MNGAFTAFFTLQSADFARSAAFFRALGWASRAPAREATGGQRMMFLYGDGASVTLVDAVETVRGSPSRSAFLPAGQGIQLTIRRATSDEARQLFANALEAGAQELRAFAPTTGGGACGVLADPDGHIWEIGHDPLFARDASGRVNIVPNSDVADDQTEPSS